MKFIFDFDFRLENNESWLMNFNHLMILVIFVLAFMALYYGLHAKSQKGIKITKLSLAFALFIFEIGRIIYRILEQSHNNELNLWMAWSFEICATMVWISIGTLIASCFVDKDNKVLIVLKNIVFGVGAVGAGLTFVMPTNIHANRPIIHFVNSQSVITHLLLVFTPFYLIKIGELKIQMKNMWMAALGFLGVLTIAMTAAHISGNNFFIVLHDNLFNRIIPGGGFPHPTQIIVIFIIGSLLASALYAIFKVKEQKEVLKEKKSLKFITVLPYLTGIALGLLTLWLPAILGADFGAENYLDRALKSWIGIFIFIPFIIQVILIYYLDKYKNKVE